MSDQSNDQPQPPLGPLSRDGVLGRVLSMSGDQDGAAAAEFAEVGHAYLTSLSHARDLVPTGSHSRSDFEPMAQELAQTLLLQGQLIELSQQMLATSETVDTDTPMAELLQAHELLQLLRKVVADWAVAPGQTVMRWLTQAGATVEAGDPFVVTSLGGQLADATPILVNVPDGQTNEDVVNRLAAATVEAGPRAGGCAVALLVYQEPPDALAQIAIARARLHDRVIVIPIPLAAVDRALIEPGASAALLAEYAERYLPGADLFDDRNAVADSMLFSGREGLLERLSSDLTRCQGVGVFGLRKSGKTSTLLQLSYQLRAHPVVHVDLQRHAASAQFGAELLDDILRQLVLLVRGREQGFTPDWEPFAPKMPIGEIVGPFVDRFGELVQRLEQGGMRLPVVCLFDEMERLLPLPDDPRAKADEFNACFGTLRALSQERRQLALLVADVHPDCNRISRWPQASAGTNPLYGFFKEVFLQPFSGSETTEMLTKISQLMGWGFDKKTLKAVHAAGGGHPFLSRQLASLLGKRLHPSESATIPWADARRIVERAVQESGTIKDYFGQNVWADLEARDATTAQAVVRTLAEPGHTSLTEDELYTMLADQATPGVILDALQWLESVGLAQREERGETDAYRLSVPLFARWLVLQFGSVASTAMGPA